MRIGIDVRYLSHGLIGGVHSYIMNFVPELLRQAADHQIFLYADTKCQFELHGLPAHVTVRYLPWRSPLSSVHNDLFMRRQLEHDRLDVVHYPANYGFGPSNARTVITLHDALTIMPLHITLASRGSPITMRRQAMTLYLYACSRLALRRAHSLLTVSEYSRREIARYSSFDPQRIVVAPLAPAPELRRVEDPSAHADVRQRYELTKPFVIADALKNPGVILRAWQRLPPDLRDRYQIVFFSRHPGVLPEVHEGVAAGHARLLLRVPRADLTALYSIAEVFVFPSWFEGFGLPIIESMICGAPVIASDRCSIPEVTNGAALLTDAEDDAELALYIQRVLTNPAEARRLRELGFVRAANYSWIKTARRILECYEQVAHAA
jgi:glycosyltransferase involved in cell wall biosynthesis